MRQLQEELVMRSGELDNLLVLYMGVSLEQPASLDIAKAVLVTVENEEWHSKPAYHRQVLLQTGDERQ